MSVRSALKQWAAAASGYAASKIVASWQKGPAPTGEHIVIGRPTSRRTSPAYLTSESRDVDGVLTQVWEQPLVYTVSIEVLAADGWDVLDDLALEVNYYTQRKVLSDAGLALVDYSEVRDLTEAGHTEPDYRFQRDFEFYGTKQITKTDYSLDTFAFQGEIVSDATGTDVETYSVDFTEE